LEGWRFVVGDVAIATYFRLSLGASLGAWATPMKNSAIKIWKGFWLMSRSGGTEAKSFSKSIVGE